MPLATFQEPICSTNYSDQPLHTNSYPKIAFKLVWVISTLLRQFSQAVTLLNISVIDISYPFLTPPRTCGLLVHCHWTKNCLKVWKSLKHVWLLAIPWTAAFQAPLSVEFPKQEYWSGLPLPSPGDLPDPGIEPWSPALQGSEHLLLYHLSQQGNPSLTYPVSNIIRMWLSSWSQS